MGATWQQWSAASLASGAVLLVLASLMLPADGADVASIIASVQDDSGRWVMAAFANLVASVALTLGLPSVLALLTGRARRFGLVAVGVWAMGTIGLAAYAALLIFFRAVVPVVEMTPAEAAQVADDRTLLAFVLAITVAFLVGELLTAIALLRARALPVWVATLLMLHALVATVAEQLPPVVERAQVLLFGVAIMGVAVRANEVRVDRRSTVVS
jgi:hypothetical protein